jgi:hypothetical protein
MKTKKRIEENDENDFGYNVTLKWRYGKDLNHPLINRNVVHNETVCTLIFKGLNTEKTVTGITYKNPCDQFCKEVARKLSLKRALNTAKLTREERTIVWKTYFNRKKNIVIS